MEINGLILPQQLIELIHSNQWKVPPNANEQKWKQAFKSYYLDLQSLVLYGSTEIVVKTNLFLETDLNDTPIIKISSHSTAMNNAQIPMDKSKAIVIGDLISTPDDFITPFCLYYHENSISPMLIYLPDDPYLDYWVQLSPNFSTFAHKLGFLNH